MERATMQEINVVETLPPEQTAVNAPRAGVITLEMVVYAALALLALVLRLADLAAIPLTEVEARQALSAWNVLRPETLGQVAVTPSPLLFALQAISFNVLGGNEFAARVLTALAGVCLVLSPLLFRDALGRTRALLLSVILTFSPVLLLASRFSSPVIWSLLLAVLGLWALRRFRDARRPGYTLLATALFAGVIFLTDPGSVLLALTLLGAIILTGILTRADESESLEGPPSSIGYEMRSTFEGWPLSRSLGLAALLVVLVATCFLTYQPGLSNVGELLASGTRALTTAQPGAPRLYALLVSLFYEPFLWAFGLIGALVAWRRGLTAVDRFFALWLLLGVIATILFVGATPAHALWLTVPLAALASRAVSALLEDDTRGIWHFPRWSRWLLAGITMGLMAMFSISLQSFARNLSRVDPNVGLQFTQPDILGSVVVMIVVGLFFIVGFFLAVSVWDTATAARGAALGLLIFGAFTSLGAGWNAAVPHADNPVELWHLQSTTQDAPLLRETLFDIAKRTTRGFPSLTVTVAGEDSGILGWLLRDFDTVSYVRFDSEADGEPVVLTITDTPGDIESDLGGNYVGQDFMVKRNWSIDSLRTYDLLDWWLRRETPIKGAPAETIVLWLRQDIYAGTQPTGQ
jgi:hypothetical protein